MTEAHAKMFDILKRRKFNIMVLPSEIRYMIFSLLVETVTIPVYLRGVRGLPPTAVPLPLITQAGDRKLRMEAIWVATKQVTLELHSGPGNQKLQQWLASLDLSITNETTLRTGFDAVHALSFPYFSRFPHAILPADNPNNDIELMRRCANLRTVTLTFVYQELHDAITDEAKPIAQLRSEYRLDNMLTLGNLTKLVLKGGKGMYGSTLPALQTLGNWFTAEFQAQARSNGMHVVVDSMALSW